MNIISNRENTALAGALKDAYPPYQTLDFTSISKAPKQTASSDFESLLKVKLVGPLASEYNSVFFTNKTLKSVARNAVSAAERASIKEAKRAAKRAEQGIEDEETDEESDGEDETVDFGSGNQMIRETYALYADYLARTSGFINGAFSQARYVVSRASYLEAADTPQARAAEAEYHEAAIEYILTSLKNDTEIGAAVSTFLNNLRTGSTHIIRPSEKFKGGYDILFTGLPPSGADGKGTALSVRPGNAEMQPVPRTRNFEHKSMAAEGGRYTKPAAIAGMKVSRTLISKIFGADAATFATASQRKVVQLPIDFDFKKLVTEASTALNGFGIDPRLLTNSFPTFPATFSPLFKKYFSIVAILEAAPGAISERLGNPSIQRENSEVSEESLHLMPTIGFTLAINLPEEIANFITQTPKGGRVRLTSLNTWALVWSAAYMRKLNTKSGGAEGGGIAISAVPKYVLSASSTGDLVQHRKDLKFYSEAGRTNDDDIYVANNGTLNFCPKAKDLTLDNARNYEALMEEALELSYSAGSPLRVDLTDSGSSVFALNSPGYLDKIRGMKESVKKYGGSMQAFSWDYNCILTTTVGKADKLNAIKLSGATAPDELALTDYLRKPFAKAMQLMFVNGRLRTQQIVTPEDFGLNTNDATPMLATSPFVHTFELYEYLLADKAVPDFQALVDLAAKDMEITNIETDEKQSRYHWHSNPKNNLVAGLVTADLKVAPNLAGAAIPIEQVNAIRELFARALKDSAGGATSNLARVAVMDGNDVEEDDHYFDAGGYSLHEFKNVYNYLGGRVFYHMLKAIREIDKNKLMVVNPANPVTMIPYQYIVTEIMPLATMLTKYVPDAEAIMIKGDELAERNQKNDAITQDDIRIPGSKAPDGSKPGMQMFPHQIEGHKYLRNAPRFAVLDIAPGGGKTIEVLSDIACLVRDKLCSKPLIACPSNLVRNWVEDLHKITQGKWNVIPITTDSIKSWGFERLTEMIANAPRNTVCVVGYSALSKGNVFPIIIGNHVERVSGTLEFVKKFGFDYVAMDESHRVKNPKTSTHQTIKQLCTASNVKFVRLATGTLISNTLTDVVGQAAMFSSQIFRTPEEYKSENSDEFGNFLPDTPKRARQQLARHSAVITFKRKEWAFMLPLPQEEFIPVSMEKPPEEGGMAHQMAYDAVLTSVLDEIAQELKKKDSELKKLLKDEEDDIVEDDDDGKPAPRKRAETAEDQAKQLVGQFFDKSGVLQDQGQDDTTIAELQRVLGPYIQRLEMILTDPLGDEFGAKYFGGISRDNFISNKVLKVVERIKLNFDPRPWAKGQAYFKADPSRDSDNDAVMPDICDYKGMRYVLLPKFDEKNPSSYFDRYYSHISPDLDTERWKPEKHGKVIVFCRYIRSVNAIFDALKKIAPNLAKGAVKFHGDVKNKGKGLDAFKSTAIDITCQTGVQILIANEQSISEGHNLQMASRMIRVEAPWAPGELDQAAARIFRPDPKKDFDREVIYLDWILTDNSLEVPKMGRLISKMLTKAQFDEADNPLYDKLKDYRLPMKSMGIEMLKENRETLSDISDYTDAYIELARIVGKEFREMRRTKAATMFDIDPEPMFDDALTMDFVPYVPNMELPDRNGLGLKVMTEWLQDKTDPEVQIVLDDPNTNLKGKYVNTEMGNGKIVKINFTRGDDKEMSSLVVELDSGEEYIGDISMIHVSPLLIPENVKKLPKARRLTAEQKEAMDRKKKAAEKKSGEDGEKKKRRNLIATTEIKKLETIGTLKTRAKTPVKTPLKTPKPLVKKLKPVVPEPEENNNIHLMPIMINGFLAIDAETEDDDIVLDDKHGFVLVKDYASMQIKSYRQFNGLMDWLDANFYIVPATKKRLTDLHDAFEDGKMGKFDVKQAKLGDFKNFFQMYKRDLHTMARTAKDTKTRKPELKIYPTVINGKLVLTVDIATNPIIKKYIDKAIPGVIGGSWKHQADSKSEEGGHIFYRFAQSNSVSELRAITKELVTAGFKWVNKDDFDAEIDDLKTNHGLKR